MEVFVQQLINGVTLGSIYGLIAIGYTMVFGIIGMVNFAHGDVFMVSSFVALIALLILTSWLGVGSIALALFIVLIVGLAIGAHLMHMPPRWIGVGVIVMVGLGILTGVTMTRGRDPSS